MHKKLFTFAMAAMSIVQAMAQEWIDVTSGYILNSKFTSGIDGWILDVPEADNLGRQASNYTNGSVRISIFLEAYTSAWYSLDSGTMKQTISLPKGKYRLSADAIAVKQSDGWWTQEQRASNVYLYAQPSKGAAAKKKVSTADKKPEHYSVDFTLEDKDIVDIGIMMQSTNANWVAVDNYMLEWYGVVTHVTSATMSESEILLVPTEEHYLSAYAFPEEAIFRNFTWMTSNAGVAKVDAKGKVTATGTGTCTITATSVDNEEVTTTCIVTVEDGAPTESSIVINELMAANIDVYLDPSFNYGSWAELYNPTNKGVLLGGLYVTDDENNLKQHQLIEGYGVLPAHGFAILNFDHFEPYTVASHRQIESKLDCDGGTLYVTDGTKILAKAEYPEAISRVAYARTTDGGDEWSWTGNPTPGASNKESVFATQQMEAPVVDKDGQKFSGQLQVCVNIPEGATLRYTEDGTTPTLTNGETSKTGLFQITYTTTLRLRLFKDGYLPSRVVTRSYITDWGYPLPIISVVTDENNIYSKDYGLFMQGPNGRAGAGQDSRCNWNMDWDRPVNFEYITANNEYALSQEVDFSMCGGWSRAWTPHSFKLKASKTYDLENTLDYQFFKSKPYLKNKTLQIRNGGNDNWSRIKDAALQEIVSRSGFYVDGQAWQPVHVFINGSYYDILNMREPNNKHFAYANYGIDTDEMDQFEMSPDSGYVQMAGTDEKFLEWYNLSSKCSDADVYDEICKMVDIDEYINYMAVELYLGGDDWPQNNVKGFRDRNDGKFHFVLFDLDHAFNSSSPFSKFASKKTYTFDAPRGTYWNGKSIKRVSGEIKFVTIFINMLKNDTFRKQFIDTFCIVAGSVFEPTRSKQIVTEMINTYKEAGHTAASNTGNDIISKLQSRLSTLVSSMKSYTPMKLSTTSFQSVKLSSNIGNAQLLINDIPVPTGKFNGRLYPPITFKASAPGGYKFVGWTNKTNVSATPSQDIEYLSTEEEFVMPTQANTSLTAVFVPLTEEEMIAQNAKPVMVNEVSAANTMYVNDYFKKNDWIELYNTTDTDIDIAGMYISDNANKPQKYQVPSDDVMLSTIIPAHGHKVIWADKLDNIGSDIHASFKLAAEGGDILITLDPSSAKNSSVQKAFSDTLTYAAHLGTQTFGRFPDGAQTAYLMNIPTIGTANLIGTADSIYYSPSTPEADAVKAYTKEGGLSIAYTNGVVNVKSEDSAIISLSIYTASGQIQPVNAIIRSAGQYASARVSELRKGIYIARAITSDGDECHIKFIIK